MKRLAGAVIIILLTASVLFNASALFDYRAEALSDSAADWITVSRIVNGTEPDLSLYAAELSGKIDRGIPNADKPRAALLCSALGIRADFVAATVADDSLDTVHAIIWRLTVAKDAASVSRLSSELLSRKTGEGFTVSGDKTDVDLTAMAAAALAHHGLDVSGIIEYLSDAQQPDGGFCGSFGASSESCAQVVIALTVAGIDPRTDRRFVKNGISVADAMNAYRREDGFAHTPDGKANRLATAQCMLALSALDCFDRGTQLYNFTGAVLLGQEPARNESVTEVNLKLILLAVTVAAALGVLAVLLIRRKANTKNLIYLAAGAVVCVLLILFVNIQTTQQYYSENPDPITENSRVATLSVDGADTVSFSSGNYALRDGETALTLLIRCAKYRKISVDLNGGYVRGIGGLYEFDRGALSGWTVLVNGVRLTDGADSYVLSDGDRVEWIYTAEGLK